jgi:hypothetical protein
MASKQLPHPGPVCGSMRHTVTGAASVTVTVSGLNSNFVHIFEYGLVSKKILISLRRGSFLELLDSVMYSVQHS